LYFIYLDIDKSKIMKKRFYILLILVVSISFVGCNKIDLNPHDCEEDRTMENFEKGLDDEEDNFGRDDDSDEGITDPNHDEDEDQQKRR